MPSMKGLIPSYPLFFNGMKLFKPALCSCSLWPEMQDAPVSLLWTPGVTTKVTLTFSVKTLF